VALRTPPEPVAVDLRRVVLVGMAIWLVGLVPCVLLAALTRVGWTPVWVCLAGLALGGLGLNWTARHSR
jgi:hypothetical protein